MNLSALREAASDLMNDYVETLDSDRLEAWIELFTEDATYTVMPRENVEQSLPAAIIWCPNKNVLRDRITSLRSANEFNLHYDRHVVSSIRMQPHAENVWDMEANYAVYQTTLEGQTKLFSVGRYQDQIRLDGDTLLFCKKFVVVDTFSVPTLLATPI
jgi:anthranilate 1,2-dioxygenase small subunit